MHKCLIHARGDDVGVATSDIEAGETVVGIYLDDDSATEVRALQSIPLGHKIALAAVVSGADVLEYGKRIGIATSGIQPGDYVHTHNLRSARW